MPPFLPARIAAPLGDVIAVSLVVLFAVLPFPEETFRARGLLLVVALLPAVALPFRRRWPIAAVGAALGCAVVLACAGVLAPSALIAVAITAFSVANRTRRTVGILCPAVAALVVFVASAVPLGGDLFDSRALQFVMFIVLAGALGDATRSRREYLKAMKEREKRAERSREDETRRRVAEERMRIARDLHDVVAHQISVISLSAGVASSSLETRPERAREALTTIRSASRTVLADIGSLMSLLRAEDADELRGLQPQAGLAGLHDLVRRFADVGLHVDLHRESDLAALSPAGDHIAYLALQEGLTNAHKHGASDRAIVHLRNSDGAMLLTVTNPMREGEAEPSSSGHGLRGLGERVAAVRGHVTAERVGREFQLHVSVPVEGGTSR